MVVITGYYAKPDQISKTETMARGTKALFAATSDRLPSQPTKDEQVYALTVSLYLFLLKPQVFHLGGI